MMGFIEIAFCKVFGFNKEGKVKSFLMFVE